MAGDLEDFLRRAAARRQAAAGQKKQAGPGARPQPVDPPVGGHTNARTERTIRRDIEQDEPPLVAEVVAEPQRPLPSTNRGPSLRQKRAAEKSSRDRASAKSAVRQVAKPVVQATSVQSGKRKDDSGDRKPPTYQGDPMEEILRLLQSPQGVPVAMLLREVLERPEHRWK
ncbi:MAG: hypothetical protein AAF989_11630 [Planctomycetota bacterium]